MGPQNHWENQTKTKKQNSTPMGPSNPVGNQNKNTKTSDQNGPTVPTAGHFGLEFWMFLFCWFSQWFLKARFGYVMVLGVFRDFP